MKSTAGPFVLGNFVFRLSTRRTEVIEAARQLLMPFPSTPASCARDERSCAVIDLDKDVESLCPERPDPLDPVAIVDHIFALALEQQQPCLWLDAAALTTSDDRLVLLAGASGAGKTTLALSLAMVYGWKVLSEDITLVDTSTRRIIPLARPFRLRPDSQARITEATNKKPAPLVLGRWFFDRALFSQEQRILAVSVAVLLRPAGEGTAVGLTIRDLPAAECLRSILPISNAVRMPAGIEILQDGLKEARCFELSGGSLKERREAVGVSLVGDRVEWSYR
ncbi:MAG TPA: hypothetical protein V6D08_04060 [Candidatus Obscuribacterales bacterium]